MPPMSVAWVQETLALWNQCKMLGMLGGCQLSPEGFVAFLDTRGIVTNPDQCKQNVSLESKNFTVRVTATVNDVSPTQINANLATFGSARTVGWACSA